MACLARSVEVPGGTPSFLRHWASVSSREAVDKGKAGEGVGKGSRAKLQGSRGAGGGRDGSSASTEGPERSGVAVGVRRGGSDGGVSTRSHAPRTGSQTERLCHS